MLSVTHTAISVVHRNTLRLWCSVLGAVLLFGMVGCIAYVRLGATVIANIPSPDGKWDAVLMVRNGGAMTGYATAIALVSNNWISWEIATLWPKHVFVLDDNDGAITVGDRGQIRVDAYWQTNTELVVTYPEKARVLRQELKSDSVNVRYAVSP
jgi:hypothetical protein